MRKLWIVLVAVALLSTGSVFASDVAVTGQFLWVANTDLSSGVGQAFFQRSRLKFTANVDDYNSVYWEFRGDGEVWADGHGVNQYIKNLKVTTDITGALGLMLPITVETVVGFFDTYFTGWYNQDESGFAYYYGDALAFGGTGLVYAGQNKDGALQVNIGAGPATIHLYSDMPMENFMAGLEAALPFGLDAFLAFGAPYADPGAGKLSVEAKYGMMMGDLDFAIPAYFRYDMGTSTPYFGVGAGVGFGGMVHGALGLGGDDTNVLNHVVAELSLTPVENLELYGAGYLTLAAANALTAIDLAARYNFGAATFSVGYVIGGTDMTAISMYHDETSLSNGLYLMVDCVF